jgi:DNA-binding transcriptional regulator YdaS (Cro superfamily)
MARQARPRDQGLSEAIRVAGGIGALAKICGIAPQAVSQWESIPMGRVLTIERATNIPRERLRPDLYGAPRPRPRRKQQQQIAA